MEEKREKRVYLSLCIKVPVGFPSKDIVAEIEHVLQSGMIHPERIQFINVEASYPA